MNTTRYILLSLLFLVLLYPNCSQCLISTEYFKNPKNINKEKLNLIDHIANNYINKIPEIMKLKDKWKKNVIIVSDVDAKNIKGYRFDELFDQADQSEELKFYKSKNGIRWLNEKAGYKKIRGGMKLTLYTLFNVVYLAEYELPTPEEIVKKPKRESVKIPKKVVKVPIAKPKPHEYLDASIEKTNDGFYKTTITQEEYDFFAQQIENGNEDHKWKSKAKNINFQKFYKFLDESSKIKSFIKNVNVNTQGSEVELTLYPKKIELDDELIETMKKTTSISRLFGNLYYHHQKGMPTIIKAFELHGKFKKGFYYNDFIGHEGNFIVKYVLSILTLTINKNALSYKDPQNRKYEIKDNIFWGTKLTPTKDKFKNLIVPLPLNFKKEFDNR